VKTTLLRLVLLCCIALPAWAEGPMAVLTILQGDATVLRDAQKLVVAEGARLRAGDIVELGSNGKLAQLEYPDGAVLLLGPTSRLLLAPRLAGERAKARAYLLVGWAKLTAPADVELSLASPWLDLAGRGARGVLNAGTGHGQAFAEAGDWQLRAQGSSLSLKAGGFAVAGARSKPELLPRPAADFMQALPRPFMDSLPARAAQFAGKEAAPRPLAAISYADAQAWLNAETPLRKAELARWRPLAKEAEFRKGLVADLKLHPEWEPILFPPPPTPTSAVAR
jgi:hypothetical protein